MSKALVRQLARQMDDDKMAEFLAETIDESVLRVAAENAGLEELHAPTPGSLMEMMHTRSLKALDGGLTPMQILEQVLNGIDEAARKLEDVRLMSRIHSLTESVWSHAENVHARQTQDQAEDEEELDF